MTTIQLVIAVAGFVSIIAGFIGGAWINQRGLERQMEVFRNEIKAELRAVEGKIAGEIGTLRAEQIATREIVSRIDQIFQRLYQPVVPPGRGD